MREREMNEREREKEKEEDVIGCGLRSLSPLLFLFSTLFFSVQLIGSLFSFGFLVAVTLFIHFLFCGTATSFFG
jgi:hypothetical protein